MRNNVAITGIMKCGKSHVSKILVENGWELYKFATPIKKIVAEIIGISLEELEVSKEKQYQLTDSTINSAITTVKNILMFSGVSKFGADSRVDDAEVVLMPNPQFGGMTTEAMVYEVDEMLRHLNDENATIRMLLQRLGTDVMRNWNKDVHVDFAREALAKVRKPLVFDDARFENELEYLREELNADVYWLHRPTLTQGDFHESECSISNEDADHTIMSLEGELLTQAAQSFVDHGSWPREIVMT